MTVPRFRQRYVMPRGNGQGGGPTPPPVVDKRKPQTWIYDIGRVSNRGVADTATRQLMSQFDGCVFVLNYLSGSSTTNLTNTLDYILNDAGNPYRNTDFKSLIYQIPFEAPAMQIASLSRSGTALTVVCDNMFGTGGNGVKIRMLTGDHAVYNGDYAAANVSYNTSTKTISVTVADTGTTAADTSRNGIALVDNYSTREQFDEICARNWWSRRSGTTGPRLSWSTSFGAWDINNTEWAPLNGDGDNFAAYLARYGHTAWGAIAGLTGFFQDNVNLIRADVWGSGHLGDWNRDGTQEDRNGTASGTSTFVQASHRAGLARFADTHRALSAGRMVGANADNDLGSPEWSGKYDLALFENADNFTTATCVARVAQAGNLIGDKVVWYHGESRTSRGGTGLENDYPTMRKHMARALTLGFTAYGFSGASESPSYFIRYRQDEYDAPLGVPVDGPQVAARSGNLWYREFSNGVTVFNNGSTQQQLNLTTAFPGKSFRKLSSADLGRTPLDPTFNNGAAVSVLTLAGASGGSHIGEGAILIRSDT